MKYVTQCTESFKSFDYIIESSIFKIFRWPSKTRATLPLSTFYPISYWFLYDTIVIYSSMDFLIQA